MTGTKKNEVTAIWPELVAAFLPLALMAAWIIEVQASQPLSLQEVKIQATDLKSLAAEGQLIAAQTMVADVTANYFGVHTKMWHQKIDQTVEDHELSEPQAGLELPFRDVGRLARQLSSVSEMLTTSFGNRSALLKVKAQLAALETEARMLEKRLGDEQS
jgi:hypothetical protein